MIEKISKNKYRFIVSDGSGASRRRWCKTITFDGGKKALQKIYEEYAEECMNSAPTSKITIGELLEHYISYSESLGRKATTIRGYNIVLNRFDSRFKSLLAKDTTTYHIEKEIARMSRESLSAKTIKNSIGLLSSAFEHAIYTKQLSENPCKYANLPQGQPREIVILHHDEIQDFLYALSDVPLDDKVAYELALFMGLRRSEILGLKEADVDVINGMLFVHNTRHRVNGKDIDQDTKTKRSTRVLAMPELVQLEVAKLLEVHRNLKYEHTDYLIQDGFGNPLQPQALASRLARLEEKKDLPKVSLHGLRHTYASLLHSQGIDMARISAELGHSNLTTTANIYVKMFQDTSQSSRGIASCVDSFTQAQKKLSTTQE